MRVTETGEWEGPTYAYRGAVIWTNAASTKWQVWIDGHPLRGLSLRDLARAVAMIDAWVEDGRLPSP